MTRTASTPILGIANFTMAATPLVAVLVAFLTYAIR
jgi:hypothetical protein